jgi:predicted DNA-binding WGR domain protein
MEIKFIGWCKQDNHDKVWGIGKRDDGDFMTFWGRRGNKLQTNNKSMGDYEAMKLVNTKRKKGYQEFSKDELDLIHENFRKQVFVVQLKG